MLAYLVASLATPLQAKLETSHNYMSNYLMITPRRLLCFAAILSTIGFSFPDNHAWGNPPKAQTSQVLLTFSNPNEIVRGLKLSESDERIELQIDSTVASSATVFSVPDPARVVVDLAIKSSDVAAVKKSSLRRPRNLPITKGTCCEAVRIAAHQDKIRIVLDLRGDQKLALASTKSSNRVVATLSHTAVLREVPPAPTATTAAQKPAIISATRNLQEEALDATPSASSQSASSQSASSQSAAVEPSFSPHSLSERAISEASVSQSSSSQSSSAHFSSSHGSESSGSISSPIAGSAVTLVPETSIQPRVPALTSIQFSLDTPEAATKGKYVRLITNHRPQYQLEKKDKKTYRLRINSCSLAVKGAVNGVGLPYFPPQDFEGVNMILASQKGSDVIVEISVDPQFRVTAIPGDDEIQVLATR